MHAEFFSSFALIAAMTREYFEDVALLKFTYSFGVSSTGGMHLEDEVVEFTFQSQSFLLVELKRALVGSLEHAYFSVCDEMPYLIQSGVVCFMRFRPSSNRSLRSEGMTKDTA